MTDIDPKRAAEFCRVVASTYDELKEQRAMAEYAAALCERESAVSRLLDLIAAIPAHAGYHYTSVDNDIAELHKAAARVRELTPT